MTKINPAKTSDDESWHWNKELHRHSKIGWIWIKTTLRKCGLVFIHPLLSVAGWFDLYTIWTSLFSWCTRNVSCLQSSLWKVKVHCALNSIKSVWLKCPKKESFLKKGYKRSCCHGNRILVESTMLTLTLGFNNKEEVSSLQPLAQMKTAAS